jgi:hypothetical protein
MRRFFNGKSLEKGLRRFALGILLTRFWFGVSSAEGADQRLTCTLKRNSETSETFWVRGPSVSRAASQNLQRLGTRGIHYQHRIAMGSIQGAGGWIEVEMDESSNHWMIKMKKDSRIAGQRLQVEGREIQDAYSFPPLRRGKSILYATATFTDTAASNTPTRIDLDCHLNSGS